MREGMGIAVAAACVVLVAGVPCRGDDANAHRPAMTAGDAFEGGMGAWGVRLRDKDRAVILYDRVLVEDDGPGISADQRWMKTDRAPTTAVAGAVRIKKVLHVERPEAAEARLYYGERGLSILVNGRPVDPQPGTGYPKVPASLLKKGDNEIILFSSGQSGQKVKIALPEDILRNAPERLDRPRRSFLSEDDGRTWKPVLGEHMVRLHLVQHVSQGHFISPVIDMGQAPGQDSPLVYPVAVRSVSLVPDWDVPKGTSIALSVRTGTSPVYEQNQWTDWKDAGSAASAVTQGHRYLQWRATLKTDDPAVSPALKGVRVQPVVEAAPRPAWASRLTVKSVRNEPIRYTSIPFAYEDPNHPKMAALRTKYKLDEVVAGAKTELEAMVKLRHWVANQWRFKAPAENYPAWDADEILTRKYGFCVQYAIVFMQCATALGRQSRFVFGNHSGAIDGGGHEVAEWWSNEHGKWVFFDCNQNWFYINPKTGVPYSMLEVHDALIREYYGGGFAEWAKRPREAKYSPDFACCYGASVVPNEPSRASQKKWHIKDGLYRVPSRWLHVRYMPRNNFLAQPTPVPKVQGCHWDYSDYVIWEDAQTPRDYLYRNFTARRNDVNWSINQVRFAAACGDKPGVLDVQLGTFTPYFDTYLVNVDGKGWAPADRAFTWTLHAGTNRLEMRVRNTSGVLGLPSLIELEYAE